MSPTLPPSLLVSDALHNIADGAAVAAGFLISIHVGIAVGIAVIAHEVPQEVGDYAVLRAAGWRRTPALFSLAAVQFTAFPGAAGVLALAERVEHLTAAILSLAAGTFLYIGATDLLPEVHSDANVKNRSERMFGFLAGIQLSFWSRFLGSRNTRTLGARQLLRGESEPPEPTFGALGIADRLN